MISRVVGLCFRIGPTIGIDRALVSLRSSVHIERIGRIKIHHPVVFQINTRHPIVGGRKEERVVKTDLQGARFHIGIPVHRSSLRAQPEVPLPYHPSPITCLAEELRQGEDIGWDA